MSEGYHLQRDRKLPAALLNIRFYRVSNPDQDELHQSINSIRT